MINQNRLTQPAQRALDNSLRVALQLGHNYIQTEHLLLALLEEPEGAAKQILERLEIDKRAVMAILIDLLTPTEVYGRTDYRTDAVTSSDRDRGPSVPSSVSGPSGSSPTTARRPARRRSERSRSSTDLDPPARARLRHLLLPRWRR